MFIKHCNMIWEIAIAEFRTRDQGTFLGFIWTMLYPLIYFLVLYNLFVKWMGMHIPDFPLYLIIGIVQWNFFSAGTSNSITAIVRYGTYIKSINFPKSILVISSVLSTLFSHILELLVLILFLLIVKGHVSLFALNLIPILILTVFLVTAISFILATIGVYFLDINRIWAILTNIGFFITPIFYTLDLISPSRRNIILLNPMTHIIKASRDVLIDNKFPQLSGLGYVFIFSCIIFTVGYAVFKRNEHYFVEKI